MRFLVRFAVALSTAVLIACGSRGELYMPPGDRPPPVLERSLGSVPKQQQDGGYAETSDANTNKESAR